MALYICKTRESSENSEGEIFERVLERQRIPTAKQRQVVKSNMAARQEGTRDRAFGFSPDTQNKAGCFRDFLQEVIAKITGENLKAMKRFLRDVISLKVGVNCNSADELVEKLLSCHCLSEYDLDLLEDLLGVTGRSDILDLLREYKRKWPPVVESTSEKAIRELVAGKIN